MLSYLAAGAGGAVMLTNTRNLHFNLERSRARRRRGPGRGGLVALAVGVLVAAGLVPMGAFASHQADHVLASLPGSEFEIDVDANLKAEDAGWLDWGNVSEQRRSDEPTGRDDDSYAGGAKEDDICPGTTKGSIPNNKSDLLTFGAYQEPDAGGPGFLHLFWTRVSEPSGTTLMDFELSKSTTGCGNGVNNVRTAGDLLIEYRIEQGGAAATVMAREWTGTAWGPAQDVTAIAMATGTINSSPIPAAESDVLGSLSPRTFGEMSLDLDFVFDDDKCESFGSAFLKSRASDSFNSQLKDFIDPIDVTVSNCGKVVIRKETNPDESPNATDFGFTKSFGTDPPTPEVFTLRDDGVQSYDNVLIGAGYTVVEDLLPTGWAFHSVDCAVDGHPGSGVTPGINGATVTFAIDDPGDVLDCTYTNRAQTGAIRITKTRKHAAGGSHDQAHAGVTFTVTGGSLPPAGTTVVTDSAGVACVDGLVFSGAVGQYTVTETVPAGYSNPTPSKQVEVTSEAGCSPATGTPASVSFHNTPLTDITVSVDSQVDGGTASTISCELDSAEIGAAATDGNGDGSLTVSDLPPGTYVCTVLVDP
jgi:hypothetical protein